MSEAEIFPPAQSAEDLVQEAIRLFCDLPTNSDTEEAISQERSEFFLKLGSRYRQPESLVEASSADQLLYLLHWALLESPAFSIQGLLMDQEEYRPFSTRFSEEWIGRFLSKQRQIISDYLHSKKNDSLELYDGRKRATASTDPGAARREFKELELLVFCYQRMPEATLASPLVEAIDGQKSGIRGAWRARLRDERKKLKRTEGRDFRAEGGLSRLQGWLFKRWTDPCLPLCFMSLADIYRAAKMSPELLRTDDSGKGKLHHGISEEAIRKIQERVGLSRTAQPLVKNVRKMETGWPNFDSDICI